MGGMESRILRLAHGLDSTIYDVRALSLRPTPGTSMEWPAGRHNFFPIEPGVHLDRLRELARFIRAGRFSIVHSHNWATMFYGVLAGRLARVPVVLHGEHGANEDDWKGVSRKREAAAALLARLATRVVAVNDFIGRDIQKRWRLPPSHVVSVPNGVDLVRFRPGPRARQTHSQLVIGTVARFDRIKNLPCIIRGFQVFKKMNPEVDARLVLVGTGPFWEEVRALAAGTDCAALISLPGEATRPEDWYARFDVYVNGSFSEGMSNTILEGMACGLPIVASDVPGNRCWLEEGVNALFFASDNPEELASRLTCLARDPGLLRCLGDENRRLTERAFDNRDFVERYHQLYRALLRR